MENTTKRVTRKSLRSSSVSITKSDKDDESELAAPIATPDETEMAVENAEEMLEKSSVVAVTSRRPARKETKPDLNQSLNIDNREIINTRSKNRMSLCTSLFNLDNEIPKSLSNSMCGCVSKNRAMRTFFLYFGAD
jgi:hypothetical protein